MKRVLTTLALLAFLIPASASAADPANVWEDSALVAEQLSDLNSTLPSVDDFVRWDSIVLEGKVIVFHFTVLRNLDSQELFYFQSGEYEANTKGLGCIMGPEPFAAGYTFRILLVNPSGTPIIQHQVVEEDCNYL